MNTSNTISDQEIKALMQQAYEARADDETRISAMIKGCRSVIAACAAKALEGMAPESVDYPEYHSVGMGCGLEDRGIRDRYEAMLHGWECAIERCKEMIPEDWYPAAQVSALIESHAELKAQVSALEQLRDEAREAFILYKRSVDTMNLAIKDGINVHGALAALIGTEEMLDHLLKATP